MLTHQKGKSKGWLLLIRILATARGYLIICFVHVTNTMATAGDDFEKGPDQGSLATLAIIGEVVRLLSGVTSASAEA